MPNKLHEKAVPTGLLSFLHNSKKKKYKVKNTKKQV